MTKKKKMYLSLKYLKFLNVIMCSGRDIFVLNEGLGCGVSLGGLDGHISDGGKDNGDESGDHTDVLVVALDDSVVSKLGGVGSGVSLLGFIVVVSTTVIGAIGIVIVSREILSCFLSLDLLWDLNLLGLIIVVATVVVATVVVSREFLRCFLGLLWDLNLLGLIVVVGRVATTVVGAVGIVVVS